MTLKAINYFGIIITVSCLLSTPLSAQNTETINWLSFEELDKALAAEPKKVFIDFYTDWCIFCRKMDQLVFTKPEVIELLNDQYYAVRFNAETDSTITFSGQLLINDQIGKSRTPIHQIAQYLALRDGQFVAPTMVLLDDEFNVVSRHFEYLDSKKLLKALKRNK